MPNIDSDETDEKHQCHGRLIDASAGTCPDPHRVHETAPLQIVHVQTMHPKTLRWRDIPLKAPIGVRQYFVVGEESPKDISSICQRAIASSRQLDHSLLYWPYLGLGLLLYIFMQGHQQRRLCYTAIYVYPSCCEQRGSFLRKKRRIT